MKSSPACHFKAAKLSEEQIARIREWINAGAPYDGPLNAKAARRISSHWAFQAPKKPPVPQVKNAALVRNPIDAFIAAEQEKRQLHPMPPADKRVLLRRVYLDLIGLPPTPDEVQAFLADNSRDAYEKVVDSLLARPQYGERWGRHWMDIWRYSDVYGERRPQQPAAHLALARLDHRLAEPGQRLRPDDRGDAGRR